MALASPASCWVKFPSEKPSMGVSCILYLSPVRTNKGNHRLPLKVMMQNMTQKA